MIRIGHPYRDRAPDAPPPSNEPGPNPFDPHGTHAAAARRPRAWGSPPPPPSRPPGRYVARTTITIELDVANADEVERAIEKIREATRLGADARAHRQP